MYHDTVSRLAHALDSELRRQFAVIEERVVVSPMVNPDGSMPSQLANKLIMTLVNVERPEGASASRPTAASGRPAHEALTLMVLLAANFSGIRYGEGLNVLSCAAAFLQERPMLPGHEADASGHPAPTLRLELVTLDLQAQQSLWAMLGASYRPSVLCRVSFADR